MNLSPKQNIDVDKKLMDTKGGNGEWDGLGDWDRHIFTSMYNRDN